MDGYRGKERRTRSERRALSEDQINEIARQAAEKALEQVYSEVGKGVLKKLLWVLGAIILSVGWWLFKSNRFIF